MPARDKAAACPYTGLSRTASVVDGGRTLSCVSLTRLHDDRMLKLSLDALLTVDTIARRGSFAAAAKELFRVPSTISYTVSKLEEDLGVQLFERFGPRVELTAAGAELLKEGRYLLKAALDLEHRVRRVASGWETELSVGMDSMFSAVALADDVRAFYA